MSSGNKKLFRQALEEITKSWWSNDAANRCGKLSPFLLVLIFFLGCIALSCPFAASRWHEAQEEMKVSNWPGLGAAFLELAAQGGEWKVQENSFYPDPARPAELRVQNWNIKLGGEGKAPAVVNTGNLLWLGRDSLILSNSRLGRNLVIRWGSFTELSAADLRQTAMQRSALSSWIELLLYTGAMAGFFASILEILLLMLVQNVLFVVVIGFLLSLVAWMKPPELGFQRARLQVFPAIKEALAITAGPAFLCGFIGLCFSYLSAYVWLAYSLLAGTRAVFLYSYNYRQARKTAEA